MPREHPEIKKVSTKQFKQETKYLKFFCFFFSFLLRNLVTTESNGEIKGRNTFRTNLQMRKNPRKKKKKLGDWTTFERNNLRKRERSRNGEKREGQ